VFSPHQIELAQKSITAVAPILQHFVLRHVSDRSQAPSQELDLYREEALAHRQEATGENGAPVRIVPGWTKWCYRTVLVAAVIGAVFLFFFHVDQYSAGPALVRRTGDRVTVHMPGTVSKVRVKAGDSVRQGDVLLELNASEQEARLRVSKAAYERRLGAFLLAPENVQGKDQLASAYSELQTARDAKEERFVRAPRAGTVGDLRVRHGMPVNPGDHVVTVEAKALPAEIVAFLPGSDRPKLSIGMKLSFDVQGYNTPRVVGEIYEIGDEVIGPREAARFLGPQAEAAPIQGPVVVVRARLPAESFSEGEQEYRFHDGMSGAAEAEIRSERLLYALVPSLRELW